MMKIMHIGYHFKKISDHLNNVKEAVCKLEHKSVHKRLLYENFLFTNFPLKIFQMIKSLKSSRRLFQISISVCFCTNF